MCYFFMSLLQSLTTILGHALSYVLLPFTICFNVLLVHVPFTFLYFRRAPFVVLNNDLDARTFIYFTSFNQTFISLLPFLVFSVANLSLQRISPLLKLLWDSYSFIYILLIPPSLYLSALKSRVFWRYIILYIVLLH